MPVRPGGAVDPASRIEAVVARQDRRFQSAFLLAVRTIRDQTTLEELADLLTTGRFEEAVVALQAAGEVLGGTYGQALVDAADDTARFLSRALTVDVRFDVSNTRAVTAIQQNRLRLIREFTNGQRETLRTALADGIGRGLNPIDQARNFRASVGLTRRQLQSVENFRSLLTEARADGLPSRQALNRALRDGRFDRSILTAIRDNRPLDEAQVDRMVTRFRERLVRHRAEVIGRTEALRSAHQGTEEMYRQAIDSGQFTQEQMIRTWVTAGDERVRGSHVRLNGLARDLDQTWPGDDGPLRFPGDPDAPGSETIRCRCILTTRLEA